MSLPELLAWLLPLFPLSTLPLSVGNSRLLSLPELLELSELLSAFCLFVIIAGVGRGV
ncbi:hypothetical protein [Ligilactobacillus salivarius]|uniref:hypothetical protein n=1 Tax=Ligilactobacillus salivarius TaxID=1624 RepID=UPI0015568237|nr:hypothetical protein [Ligilactobacillus salivarius]MCF2623993.1 hypothetical protein [Ligilactobacillus salivarius]NXZ95722.1 hypothetical protein [Ligilactobacillus salivarius]NYA60709.1 hypothetical protein [Ligilactobacillus salivarius]NYA67373.1 hypothetical protein [Ligilactobacillus salivarius]